MLHQFRVMVVVLGLVASTSTARGQIFTDDMSSGVNWTIVQDSDSSAEFGYDYSADGLPTAPSGGGDTIGLKFEVNNSAGAINEIVAYRDDVAFTGQYTLRADVWINWALVDGTVGIGTTEFAGLSVGHDGFAPGPWGAAFIFDGDGDTPTDYRLYKNLNAQTVASGQYTTASNNNSDATYVAAFPSINVATAVPSQGQTGSTLAGVGGFQWMTVNVEVDTDAIGPAGTTDSLGYARFSLQRASSGNTVTVGTVDNSNGGEIVNMEGTIALLMSDIFSSVSTNPALSFAIFDNVQVLEGLVPLTPGSLAGDYNGNDTVDAGDYTVWRDHRGQSFTLPGENPDAMTPGEVDQEDYDFWVSQFGETLGSGAASLAASQAAVPEPASALLLVVVGGAAGVLLRRKGHRR